MRRKATAMVKKKGKAVSDGEPKPRGHHEKSKEKRHEKRSGKVSENKSEKHESLLIEKR